MESNYIFHYEPVGEIVIPESEIKEGLSIYSPSLQKYTTEQIQEMAKTLGVDDYDDWNREEALTFLAWWLSGDVDCDYYEIVEV